MVIKRQTKATQDSAKAASDTVAEVKQQVEIMERQTAVLVNANRPWLLIPMGNEFSEIGQPRFDTQVSHVTFKLENFGQTPARIVQQKVRLYLGDSDDFPARWKPFEDIGLREDYTMPQTSIHPIQAYIEPDGIISVQDISEVLEGRRHLWLCGFIRYRAASDSDEKEEPYETRICYVWMTKTTSPAPFWIMRGPRSYNRTT